MKDEVLAKMNIKELRALKAKIEAAIPIAAKREMAELREKMRMECEAKGFSLSEIIGGGKGKAKAPVRFINPADPNQTWTGRGRVPMWLKGKDKEKFRV